MRNRRRLLVPALLSVALLQMLPAFVSVHDGRSGEWTGIYTREAGKERIEMLILTIDSSNAVLMTMQLKPEAMRKWVEDPLERGRDARREAQDAERGQP